MSPLDECKKQIKEMDKEARQLLGEFFSASVAGDGEGDGDDGGDGGGLKLSTLDAGHWVHVDDLDGLLKIMSKEF